MIDRFAIIQAVTGPFWMVLHQLGLGDGDKVVNGAEQYYQILWRHYIHRSQYEG